MDNMEFISHSNNINNDYLLKYFIYSFHDLFKNYNTFYILILI